MTITGAAPHILLAAVSGSLLICGGLLVYGSGKGLDLTDEIFYLVWARDPRAYALLYQPFGYLLHPLYRLVGGNLQSYRLAGFAITAAAGGFLGSALAEAKAERALLTLFGALSALTIFFPWIITPSYNSAANVGALLIVGGILYCLKDCPVAGSLAAAGGLCISAFSKPPLFVIAIAVIAFVGLGARRLGAAFASILLGTAALSLFIAPPEIPLLVRRIVFTQHLLALPNTPLALPAKIASDWLAVPLPLTFSVVAAALSLVLRRHRWHTWLGYAAIALSFYYVATIVPDAIGHEIPDFLGLAITTLALAYAALADHQRRSNWLAILLLLAAPNAVALGTFNNQWFQLNFSMAFPILAMFVLAGRDPLNWRKNAVHALCVVAPVGILFLAAWAPYSLPAPIFDQKFAVRPPLARGTVLVDEQTDDFVTATSGLARGALLIDLSGTGPGVGALLGARVPVLPWLNPATPTWPDVVWSQLGPAQRQTTWFVVPVWPQFQDSEPAKWARDHAGMFCKLSLPPMNFWGEDRSLQIWRPCVNTSHTAPPQKPGADQPA